MNKNSYTMKRGQKLVSLCLQNDRDLSRTDPTEKSNVQVFQAVGSQEKQLIEPGDLGFTLTLNQTSTIADDLDLDLFEDLNEKLLTSPNLLRQITDLSEEDSSYIENSQGNNYYTDLQCPSKKIKDFSHTIISQNSSCFYSSIKDNESVKPVVNIPDSGDSESPCISESETDITRNGVSKNDAMCDIQPDDYDIFNFTDTPSYKPAETTIDITFQNPDTTTNAIILSSETIVNTIVQNPEITTNTTGQKRKKKQQRKQQVKFPKYSMEERVTKSKEKHHMITDHCGFKCRRECRAFDNKIRADIWNTYWTLTHDRQIKWLARYIHLQPVKAKRSETDGDFKKNESRTFFLPYTGGLMKQVCKKFFLNTFGYKNDSIVTTISKKLKIDTTLSLSDKRGTHNKPKVDTSIIEEYIGLYKPCTAHYRRHNAPNAKYLAQDVTLEQIYTDFQQMHPEFKCCKEIIRRTLKDMNISLHRPQSDKCFDCLSFEVCLSENKKANEVPSLKLICSKIHHKNKAKAATDSYNYDANREKMINERVYSMDLQKSVLLPMMPEVKDCFFTNRMIAFNLTFCGLNKYSIEGSKCLVWHEATGGRDGKDMVDAIYKFILSERDVKNFIFWADNCCAQNKNWILFTALATIVNVHDIESITLKFLAKGHTHMSADGVHGNIERNFKRVKNIYDFEDYKNCLQTSRTKNQVVEITSENKYVWDKKKKVRMDPIILSDLVEVKFVKNQSFMLYKKSFSDSYKELDFLQKRFNPSQLPKKVVKVRGIRSSKKKEIMDKLVQLMPSNRRSFWENLPENNNSVDLINSGQEET